MLTVYEDDDKTFGAIKAGANGLKFLFHLRLSSKYPKLAGLSILYLSAIAFIPPFLHDREMRK